MKAQTTLVMRGLSDGAYNIGHAFGVLPGLCTNSNFTRRSDKIGVVASKIKTVSIPL